jgi:hypothetical protein
VHGALEDDQVKTHSLFLFLTIWSVRFDYSYYINYLILAIISIMSLKLNINIFIQLKAYYYIMS